ncbi:MAG: hypothetical protein IH991_19945, partial [Planctomycetes bacterium]|nr:hypothetical protein [Planctomycetota bacterium]
LSKLFKNVGVVQTNKTVILRINKDDIKSIRARHGNAKPSCSVAEIKIDVVTNTQKLPTAHFSKDDVQYFASGKEFKLQLEAGQQKARQAARKHHVATKDAVAPNVSGQWRVIPGNHGTVFWHSKASSHPKVDVFVAGTAKKSSKHCRSAKVTKRAPQHSAANRPACAGGGSTHQIKCCPACGAKPLVTWTPQHPHIVGAPLPQPIPHVLPPHADNHYVELLHAKKEIVRLQARLEWQERISELKEKHVRELHQAQIEVSELHSRLEIAAHREEVIQQMAETEAERAQMQTLLALVEEHPEIISKRVHGGHAHSHPGVQSAAKGVSPVEAENQRLRQRVAELQIRLLEIQSGSLPRHR